MDIPSLLVSVIQNLPYFTPELHIFLFLCSSQLWFFSCFGTLLWVKLCSPTKFICWSPNASMVRMWLYLEIGSSHRSSTSNEVIGVDPTPIRLVFYKKRKFGWTYTQMKDCEDTDESNPLQAKERNLGIDSSFSIFRRT